MSEIKSDEGTFSREFSEEEARASATKGDVWSVASIQHMLTLELIDCLVALQEGDKARAKTTLRAALGTSEILVREMDKLVTREAK